MKILKHGKQVQETIYKSTCPYCQCEFIYDSMDVLTITTTNVVVKCPDCNRLISAQQLLPYFPVKMEVWNEEI